MTMSLGDRIRRLREMREMNQTQLGRAVHMTQRKVSYIERDACEPSIADIVALCRFFGVSADYLLGLTENCPQDSSKQ